MFPCFPLTYMQKKFPYGSEGIRQMCVCVSVCVSPLQSQITFDLFLGWQKNIQGLLNSLKVSFGQVIWTSGPRDQALTPKNGVSRKSISSWGFGQGGHVAPLRNRDKEANKK